ncbi:MAG: T9SS type A sorting domain-containing protein [Calditrichaeota bacterium]|nr:T9SS type A sorting domain-containing protein [Calditrichota bacterium]
MKTNVLMLIAGFLFVVRLSPAQDFQIRLADEFQVQPYLTGEKKIEIFGQVVALSEDDSLTHILYRWHAQKNWQARKLEGGKPVKKEFRFEVNIPEEGWNILYLSARSKLRKNYKQVVDSLVLYTDYQAPTLAPTPAILTRGIDSTQQVFWKLTISFTEFLAHYNLENFTIKNLVTSEKLPLSGATPVPAANNRLLVLRMGDKHGGILESWVEAGDSLQLEIETGGVADRVGNVNSSLLRRAIQFIEMQIVQEVHLAQGAISPNGDGQNDRLEASFFVRYPGYVWVQILNASGDVIYQTATRVDPTDSLYTAVRDSSLIEQPNGKMQFYWPPENYTKKIKDGKYYLAVASQLTPELGSSSFILKPFYVDRKAPEIARISPVSGQKQHFITPQPRFEIFTRVDTTRESPVVRVEGIIEKVRGVEFYETLRVQFVYDTLVGGYVFDFRKKGLRWRSGNRKLQLLLSDLAGNERIYDLKYTVVADTTVNDVADLYNYPNPFNPRQGEVTAISFYTNLDNEPLNLYIYNFTGQLVYFRKIPASEMTFSSPRRLLLWNGRDLSGKIVPNGVYFCQIQIGQKKSKLLKIAVINH